MGYITPACEPLARVSIKFKKKKKLLKKKHFYCQFLCAYPPTNYYKNWVHNPFFFL